MTDEQTKPRESVIQRPDRVFKIGATILQDPDPDLPPEEALKLYEPSYPFLRDAQLSAPEIVDEKLVYEVERKPVKTKGAA